MMEIIASVIGGVGLFLLGMILMTEGLKALAGGALGSILSRFTTNRLSALGTGAAVTAIVQSSSATTLATIGFVSAGILSFQNAAGVIIGANLGTTSTGWLVSLLGLKLSIGSILLPLIGFGALAKLMGKGKIAQAGLALAGFGVIFVGIDTLQAGMKELSVLFNPADFPAGGMSGSLLLVLIGAAMTIVMQSSSAAVATTLAALSGGTINLEQAAALVIGQNVGTTVTAAIAAIGASTQAKRTALVHIFFNAGTGFVAFMILPWFIKAVDALSDTFFVNDDAITIAFFHTAFNILGVIIFMPFLPYITHWIELIIKNKGPRLTRNLDASLVSVPTVALEALRRTLKEGCSEFFHYLAENFHNNSGGNGDEIIEELNLALAEARIFLFKIPPPGTQGHEYNRQISTMHAIDHLERLISEIPKMDKIKMLRDDPQMKNAFRDFGALLDELAAQLKDPDNEPDVEAVERFSLSLADIRRSARPAILEATALKRIDPDRALEELSAQRWFDRVAYHVWRASHHLRELNTKELTAEIMSSADSGAREHA